MHIPARGPAALGAVAVVTVLLAAVAGCSSDSDKSGAGESDSALLGALGTLADQKSAKQVTYLDSVEVRKVSKGDAKRFAIVSQPGGALVNSFGAMPFGEHFKLTQIDNSVDAPRSGHWEGSFDAKSLTESLKSNGYERSERGEGGERGGGEVWMDAGKSGMVFRVSDDEISYSSTEGSDPLSAVTPKEGSSLADNKEYRRAAECLGDVYRADFSPLTSSDSARLAALGQRAASAAKNTEVLCFVVKDEKTAERLADKLRSAVSDKSPKFDGTKVTVEKGELPFVRAVVPDTAEQRPGRLLVGDEELWLTVADL